MQQEIILFIIGVIGLWLGAGITINGAVEIAKKFKISYLFVGLTILSIGTSLPEIFTHIASSWKILNGIEASGVAVGTNIGSNIIQITLIMGMLGLFAVIKSSKQIQKRDGLIMLGSIALLWLFGLNGVISQIEGLALATLYVIYIYWISRSEKSIKELIDPHHKPLSKKKERHIFIDIGHVLFGLALLGVASMWVVDNTLFFANHFGIEQTFFGLVVIGVSTALPELTTAVRGVMKGAKQMSLGVLIGSNITNPMLALGIGAAISGYKVSQSIQWFDIPFWFFISALALLFFHRTKRLEKWEAAVLVISYIAYVAYKIYGVI
ncbi:calcium/sodium antiporter [Candidatus Woesearchaeota archaeon]|jgi:cation:H+ antiporter|nr:calcium/sodium antiporter [Candidatus Woesearchaeota archaeon]MBT7062349.1 calcium/sodium antiporter [Candidatus Woesearchaeota archaeon]MBT7402832.1 calcium/sodium antiporter [Candidatus Woesearchaeota archaeon]